MNELIAAIRRNVHVFPRLVVGRHYKLQAYDQDVRMVFHCQDIDIIECDATDPDSFTII